MPGPGRKREKAILFFEHALKSEIFLQGEMFEMLSEKLQSRPLIESIIKPQRQFPDVDTPVNIQYAELAFRDK